jgi:hypothetical protein
MSSQGTRTYATVMPSETRMIPRFTALCAGSIIGAELIFADSFR